MFFFVLSLNGFQDKGLHRSLQGLLQDPCKVSDTAPTGQGELESCPLIHEAGKAPPKP